MRFHQILKYSLCFLLFGSILSLSQSKAQDRRQPVFGDPSHILIPDDGMGSLSNLWKKRKNQGNSPSINQQMLKSLLEQLDLQDLQNIDPKQLGKLVQENPLFQDKENIDGFKDFLKDWVKDQQQNPNNNPLKQFDPEKIADPLKKLADDWAKEHPNDPKGIVPNFNPPPPPPPPPNVNPKQLDPEGKEGLDEMTKWFNKNMGQMDFAKDMVKDFTDWYGKGGENDLPDWMQGMGDWGIGDLTDWASNNMGGMKLDLKIPDISFGGGGGSGGGGLGFGGGGGSGGNSSIGGGKFLSGGSLTGIFVLVIFAAVGIVAWLLVQRIREQKARDSLPILFSTNPIDPNDVHTRQDLILAFDRLSVIRCGADARMWNHRVISGQLGQNQPLPEQQSADQLGRLYEFARYTPLTEEITEKQLSEARSCLRLLTPTPEQKV